MSPIRFTNMLFNFKHIPVSHLSNSALTFRKHFTRVPSVLKFKSSEIDVAFSSDIFSPSPRTALLRRGYEEEAKHLQYQQPTRQKCMLSR